ncbi:6528_t:CDS:2 [Funneliformis caledonium]|uniref:6528_t:CDS:1 n=1 Tax=Funneliformis caledonium TaxID=1117310 RepID=A0A9N8WJY2_9GLOM|nr:6528_t:CDS:2 [Funneliformis caledonium]
MSSDTTSEFVIEIIQDFNWYRLTEEQEELLDELIPNEEAKRRFKKHGLCRWYPFDVEYRKQCDEAEEYNKSLLKPRSPAAHPQAIYTSRRLVVDDLPEPQNSKEFNDQYYNGSVSLEFDFTKLKFEAEFFNTISSFCMVCAGVFGVMMHYKGFELRYPIAFASIIVVGIGSILFHGTLLFSLQLFDEIPMVFCVLTLLYSVVENKPQKRFGNWFPILLICWGIGIIYVMIHSGKEHDNELMQSIEFYVFQGTFVAMSIFVYAHTIMIVLNPDGEPSITRLWLLGSAVFSLGYIGWHIDLRFCSVVHQLPFALPNPQLHAWWHLMASYGSYLLCVFVAYDRAKVLGKKPTLKWMFNALPFVQLSSFESRDEKSSLKNKKELPYDEQSDEKTPLIRKF